MKSHKYILLILLVTLVFSCSKVNEFKIKVSNPGELSLKNAFVNVEVKSNSDFFILRNDENEIPYQLFTIDGKKQIAFVLDLEPKEEKVFTLKETDERRKYVSGTYAELSMKGI
ncbi:MAG: DUF4861 family protein [Ignavibacteriaceae bacterium]